MSEDVEDTPSWAGDGAGSFGDSLPEIMNQTAAVD
jgi:hypothetical protein